MVENIFISQGHRDLTGKSAVIIDKDAKTVSVAVLDEYLGELGRHKYIVMSKTEYGTEEDTQKNGIMLFNNIQKSGVNIILAVQIYDAAYEVKEVETIDILPDEINFEWYFDNYNITIDNAAKNWGKWDLYESEADAAYEYLLYVVSGNESFLDNLWDYLDIKKVIKTLQEKHGAVIFQHPANKNETCVVIRNP